MCVCYTRTYVHVYDVIMYICIMNSHMYITFVYTYVCKYIYTYIRTYIHTYIIHTVIHMMSTAHCTVS